LLHKYSALAPNYGVLWTFFHNMTESTPNAQNDAEAITPYSMHVSQRYLDLTRQKLELTRLPRELELPEGRIWEHGTPKSVLEPLLDFWYPPLSLYINHLILTSTGSTAIPGAQPNRTSTPPSRNSALQSPSLHIPTHMAHKPCASTSCTSGLRTPTLSLC
jgi:hypothetical protein